MKKLLVTLMCVAMVLALMPAVAFAETTSVGNAEELENAISSAVDGDVITLTKDIDLVNDSISINKAITITGGTNKYAIKSTALNVIKILDSTSSLDGKIVLDNLTIKATNTSKKGRAIGLGDSSPIKKLELDVNNCVIETTQRGITVNPDNNTGIALNVNNSSISLTNGIINYDEQVNETNDFNNSRGISLWEMGKSRVNISNSTIQGFFYSVNSSKNKNSSEGTVVSLNNSTFKGRAAINSWADGVEWTVTDCKVHGINIFPGESERFGSVVLNGSADNNEVKITNSKFTTFFNEDTLKGNAMQYMIDNRNENSIITIKGTESSYISAVPLERGGVARGPQSIVFYGGTYSHNVADEYLATGYGSYLRDGKYVVAPKATGIKLDKESASVEVGKTVSLKATVTPAETLDTVAWTTDKAAVATVNDGVVTAEAPGTATITATVNGKTATCKVSVYKVAEPPKVDNVDTTKPVEEVKPVVKQETVAKATEEAKTVISDIAEGKATTAVSAETKAKVEAALDAGKTITTEVVVETVKEETVKDDAKKADALLADSNVKKEIGEAKIAQYLNLEIVLKADGQELGTINELSEKMTFTIAVPEELKGKDRVFYVVRVHNGQAEVLPTTMNADGTISFSTDKFSTYALAYTDTAKATTPTTETPKTGDATNMLPWVALMAVAGAGAVVFKKKED